MMNLRNLTYEQWQVIKDVERAEDLTFEQWKVLTDEQRKQLHDDANRRFWQEQEARIAIEVAEWYGECLYNLELARKDWWKFWK